METAKVGRNGAVIIPTKIRRRFGLKEGSMVMIEKTNDGISIRPAVAMAVEVYSLKRRAEFLLNNAVDAPDYKRAVSAVRKLEINLKDVPHRKP